MALTIWEQMRERVAAVMIVVNASASHIFKETPAGIDVRSLPLSVFDGAYSLEFRGFPVLGQEVNGKVEVDVNVRINIAFLFNIAAQYDDATGTLTNDKREYTRAINDLLTICLAMQVSTEFEGVDFLGTTPFEGNELNDQMGVCGIDYTLSTTVTP
jgi:hypothetical protein